MKNSTNPQHKSSFFLTLSFCILQLTLALAQSDPLTVVDKMPTFPGGEIALKEYIDFNLGYISDPPTGVDQHVITRFVVSKEGLIQDVEIVQGISETLNRKALTLINNMPRWMPGQQSNQAVAARVELPIRFIVPAPPIEPAAKPASKEATNPLPNNTGLQNPTKDSTPVYKVVERMPSFTLGQAALLQYLDQNIEYPKIAKENGVQGMVVVQMIVEIDGSLSNVHVVKGIGAGCDEEAMRVVKLMPKWIPGMQRGKTVRVQFNLPIRFKLE